MTSSTEISDRLSKCFSSVIHDVMRDDGFKNFVLNPQIKPNNCLLYTSDAADD